MHGDRVGSGAEVSRMSPWSEVVPGLWRFLYVTPMKIQSNAFAVALKDGEIAIVSPPCGADDAFFKATDELGKVTALLAPNSGHDLGLAPWHARYQEAALYAPGAAAKAIGKAKPKLGAILGLDALEGRLPSGVRFSELPGTSSGSLAVSVEAGEQRALVCDEAIMNAPKLTGPAPFRFVFWITGSGPGIARNKVWWTFFCKDKPDFARALLAEMDRVKPTTIIPEHGEPISGEGLDRVRSLLAS